MEKSCLHLGWGLAPVGGVGGSFMVLVVELNVWLVYESSGFSLNRAIVACFGRSAFSDVFVQSKICFLFQGTCLLYDCVTFAVIAEYPLPHLKQT